MAFNLLLFAFRYFKTILSSRVSFLFIFLVVEGEGPRCFDEEFDSCAIHAHVTLLREVACTSSISVDDWDDWLAS
jgi:hypothetical protein